MAQPVADNDHTRLARGSASGHGRSDAELARFDISPERGFIPPADPLQQLPAAFAPWEQLAAQLPKLLMTDQLRAMIDTMPAISPEALRGKPEYERAMMLLSYLGH